LYPDAAKELLTGCTCGSHFFYYIKKEYYDKLNNQILNDVKKGVEKEDSFELTELQKKIKEIDKMDKLKIEKDVRDIIGISEKEDVPIILDLESIRVLKPGKFEIDVVNLFSKKRPLIYKLEEGKYIIDLASTLRVNAKELEDKIRDPDQIKRKKKR
jgi:predicted  nucleic acid-binding Zn-ribbon protein